LSEKGGEKMPLPCDTQVTYDQVPLKFYHHILRVLADDPCDGEILAPFDYNIYCYSIKQGLPYTTDPPPLDRLLGGPVRGKGGTGCCFTIYIGDYEYTIFAVKFSTYPGDPWEQTTSTCSGGSANMPPDSHVFGYLKFHLI